MDKLVGYSSDEDYEESPKQKRTEYEPAYDQPIKQQQQGKSTTDKQQLDANYEEVQMDLSEDSNGSNSPEEAPRCSGKPSRFDRRDNGKEENRSRSGSKSREYKSRRDDDDDRYRKSRDDRDRRRPRSERNYRSRRSSSRDRRSRSPRRSESRNGKRSKSKEREVKSKYRRSNRTEVPERVESNKTTEQVPKRDESKDRFYMPGITGRFKDQIERRKLLWQKKDTPVQKSVPEQPTGTGKVWQSTTFAQDSDGKVASKFKRLMGIREPSKEGSKGTTDSLRKQEEMFSSMEQQYEVARTATHTMRGVGLGFGSFQR